MSKHEEVGALRLTLCGFDVVTPTPEQWALRCIVFGTVPDREFGHRADAEDLYRLQAKFQANRMRFMTPSCTIEEVKRLATELPRIESILENAQDTSYIERVVDDREPA